MTEAAGGVSVAGALETVLAMCAAGRSGTVVIEGAAGCGKSRLLDAVAARAGAAGALVLRAAATEEHLLTPLGVLRQVVGSAPAFALARIGPEHRALREETVREFCARLCALAVEGPVVLCVDDVQHADAQSLRYLDHIARHARPAAVLLVVTLCPETQERHPVAVTELTHRPQVRRIALGLLTPREVAQAVEGRSVRTVAELCRLSGGNPLLLRALVEEEEQAGGAGGPVFAGDGPFAGAVAACLARCGPAAVASARAVAVVGAGASEAVLAQMLGTGLWGPGLAALRACGLLNGLRFGHPAVQDVVLALTAPRTRAGLHRRAALALREAQAPATAVAGHFLAPIAEGIRRPVRPGDLEVLRDVAEELLAQRRPEEAGRILALAHDVCPDGVTRAAVELRLAEIAAWPASAAAVVEREPLTAGEQRVAALAARGLTNRQIAAGLLLSVSTVQQRLTRIYRKLRIRGRAELPAALVQGARADAVVG
ncbi:LuxR family transcriptional regulator [Streptomyces sp. NPDC048193]|uniref:LuxR family transcriptional regulator n=1 Tax=unclassified Streptomyces TaxID=2593676 RepID=UPI00341FF225